jgi:hypothetical protein
MQAAAVQIRLSHLSSLAAEQVSHVSREQALEFLNQEGGTFELDARLSKVSLGILTWSPLVTIFRASPYSFPWSCPDGRPFPPQSLPNGSFRGTLERTALNQRRGGRFPTQKDALKENWIWRGLLAWLVIKPNVGPPNDVLGGAN